MKIGKHEIQYPIIQGGMGIGVSWDQLAGNVSLEGGLGVISTVGTAYYKFPKFLGNNINKTPLDEYFCSTEALKEIFIEARKICGNKPLAANIMVVLSDYEKNVVDACCSGVDIIISGAGLPTRLPEFTKNYPDVALVPIVSSVRALKLICKKWSKYNKIPDAIVVEGPLSGGHQGFKFKDCFKDEYQLENILPPIIEEAKNWGNIPIIAAGGIWDKNDIDKFLNIGCAGVQMGTRFVTTTECDTSLGHKNALINCSESDITLKESPVGLPSRSITSNLHKMISNGTAPKISCRSNCVAPCNHGQEAKKIGYCIADRLADAIFGKNTGLYFTGSNGYKATEIISVKELIGKLLYGEDFKLK